LTDDFFSDEFEELPGGWLIEYGELKKARDREKFRIRDGNGDYQEVESDWEGFFYYFQIWENFHFFGLPHGGGWANESPWLIEVLKLFERAYSSIEAFRIKKSSKR